MRIRLFAVLLTGIAVLSAPPAIGASADVAAIQRALEETQQRLDLSEEQQVQVEPILRAHFEDSQAVMRRHGVELGEGKAGGGKSMRELRALAKDMKPIRERTERELATVLTDQQMAEYREIQDERRDAMRERMRAGR